MPELQRRVLPGRSALPNTVPLATRIGRLAIRSLYREVALAAKPGLVTPCAVAFAIDSPSMAGAAGSVTVVDGPMTRVRSSAI